MENWLFNKEEKGIINKGGFFLYFIQAMHKSWEQKKTLLFTHAIFQQQTKIASHDSPH